MLVLATFILVIVAKKKPSKSDENSENSKYPKINFIQVLCIWYPIIFLKKSILVLLNLKSEINAIHLTFAKRLDLFIRSTYIRIAKINSIILNTYGMVVAAFLNIDQANQEKIFRKIFLVANICSKIDLIMLFFTLNSTYVDFLNQKLR